MIAHPALAPEQQMAIEEFLAFADTRPQEERWELIEGVPVLNPYLIDHHQIVVTNISGFLWRFKTERSATWFPMIGTGKGSRGREQPAAAGRDGEGASSHGHGRV
jgi:hypothetical protein